MATFECPSGHQSATDDYCDQCGLSIAGGGGAKATPPSTGASVSTAKPVGTDVGCPNCQSAPRPDEKFCEVCGYDFVAGTLPAAPTPVAAAAEPPTSVLMTTAAWQAVVTADREYYDRNDADDIAFPDHCPERVFTLSDDEVLVGRRSDSRGIRPQVDLSGAPEDTGISHSHLILRRQPGASYEVIDPGSTNGTLLNDATLPIPHNSPTTLKDGDRLYLGAWTKIVIHGPPAP
jgi:hypothetical protein